LLVKTKFSSSTRNRTLVIQSVAVIDFTDWVTAAHGQTRPKMKLKRQMNSYTHTHTHTYTHNYSQNFFKLYEVDPNFGHGGGQSYIARRCQNMTCYLVRVRLSL
jgi:hypothetical protein